MNSRIWHPKSNLALWLGAILCVGILFRVFALTLISHQPESDEIAYISMASNLVNGRGVIDHFGNRAMYNVGYPAFVLAPVFLLFGEKLLLVQITNVLLGVLSIVLCYLVAKEAGAGWMGRLLAATIWSVYLPASVYGVYILKENLMTPLVLGVMWCSLHLLRNPSLVNAAVCGFLFGLLALTGNSGLALLIVSCVAIVSLQISVKKKVVMALTGLAFFSSISGAWILRNYFIVGAPVLNTNGGFNLYLGNNPSATGMFISISQTPRGSTWEALRHVSEVHASETLKRESIAWIKSNPSEFVSLALRKAAYFWFPPIHAGSGNQTVADAVVRCLWLIEYLFLIVSAFSTILFVRLRTKQVAMLWLAVACYTAVHMLFYVIFRYREPIMPIVGILSSLALESVISRRDWFGSILVGRHTDCVDT